MIKLFSLKQQKAAEAASNSSGNGSEPTKKKTSAAQIRLQKGFLFTLHFHFTLENI
jgi:hypothetical protein